VATKDQTVETRQRLLEAAGEVFAEHGFRDATVREICEKAKANIAAAHYHFGDKEELYSAVFDYAKNSAKEQLDSKLAGTTTPEECLHAYVNFFLTRFFDEGRPAWLGKLVAQEMIEPTKVLDDLVNERIRPNHERLKAIARELIGTEIDDETLRLCAFSIAAQCFFYFHYRSVITRLYPDFKFGAEEIERLTEHITKFSLTALKEWKS
jgi:AcrR family transcriptional regulator